MKTDLAELLTESPERLTILIIDGSERLAHLRALYPDAEIHAVTPYEEVAAHEMLAPLRIHWHVTDCQKEILPFPEEMFDRIIAEFALEFAHEPYDVLMALNRRLKETGTLYTSYPNVRYHGMLDLLRAGDFPVRGERRLYAKPEIVRLLNDALYKEIHFTPGDRDDDLSAGEEWAREGFANVNDDLSTRTWLVRAERSTAAGANLKLLFSAETRRELARLLHRIEYSVAPEESKAALRALCVREGIFSEYLTDFINEVCVHDARVHAELRELFENM